MAKRLTEAQAIAALAECYRLSGADPDNNEDWRIAPDAVSEVREMRQRYDDLERENAEQRTKVERLKSIADTLRQQLQVERDNREGVKRFLLGEQVGVSIGIDGSTTYGFGDLDQHGFWQYPVPKLLVRLRQQLTELQNKHADPKA